MRIYVAGPIRKGDHDANIRNGVLAGDALMMRGHIPFIPHLTHLWGLISPGPYEKWQEWDNAWLRHCDGVLRIPGESVGADAEVALAEDLGLPVWYNIEDIPDLPEEE